MCCWVCRMHAVQHAIWIEQGPKRIRMQRAIRLLEGHWVHLGATFSPDYLKVSSPPKRIPPKRPIAERIFRQTSGVQPIIPKVRVIFFLYVWLIWIRPRLPRKHKIQGSSNQLRLGVYIQCVVGFEVSIQFPQNKPQAVHSYYTCSIAQITTAKSKE